MGVKSETCKPLAFLLQFIATFNKGEKGMPVKNLAKKSTAKTAVKPRFVPFSEAVINYFKGYITWSGRSTRAEYWWMFPINFAMLLIPVVNLVWIVATLMPTISLVVRRLHDSGKSGYWYLWLIIGGVAGTLVKESADMPLFGSIVMLLFSLVNIILMLLPSTPGKNKYGNIRK
jgi:uncharacterized membrane protein YhaH (DUF805 family)